MGKWVGPSYFQNPNESHPPRVNLNVIGLGLLRWFCLLCVQNRPITHFSDLAISLGIRKHLIQASASSYALYSYWRFTLFVTAQNMFYRSQEPKTWTWDHKWRSFRHKASNNHIFHFMIRSFSAYRPMTAYFLLLLHTKILIFYQYFFFKQKTSKSIDIIYTNNYIKYWP